MNRITRLMLRKRRFHILGALAFAVLFGSTLAEALLDLVVPRAAAQGNVTVSDPVPSVFFDDTDVAGFQWQLTGDGQSFFLADLARGVPSATFPISILPSANNNGALFSDVNGNVRLAQDEVFITRGNGVGIGTEGPEAPLHVFRDETLTGSAQILVEEGQVPANPAAPQVMFELRRPGAVRFDLVDEQAGNPVTWVFQNRNGAFDITKAGTGVQEMKVDGNGDLTMLRNVIAAAFLTASDRNLKEHFVALEGPEVLAKLTALPVTEWSFKGDPVRHIGPTAQDFKTAFGLGANDTHIATLDVASVAVVGVKELHKMIEEHDTKLAQRDAEIVALKQRLAALEGMVSRVMAQQ